MHKDITSATMQTNLAEKSSNWELNSYWVVQYYQDPRARHFDQPTLFTFSMVERLYQITGPPMAYETKYIKKESMV